MKVIFEKKYTFALAMRLKKVLLYFLISTSTVLYSQTAMGLKVRVVGFHFTEMNQDPAIFENSLTGTQSIIVEPGYELNLQQFFYSTILSVELRQGFHSDAAAKLAGHLGLGIRWKFYHTGRHSFSISVAPILTFRQTWKKIPQYINYQKYKNYKTTQWFQYKYLLSGQLEYNILVGKRSDISLAISYNNSYQTFSISLGYRHWINPYTKVRAKNCNSCGGKRWNQGRLRKFWKRITR